MTTGTLRQTAAAMCRDSDSRWHPVGEWLNTVAGLYEDESDRIVSEQAMWDHASAVTCAYLGWPA